MDRFHRVPVPAKAESSASASTSTRSVELLDVEEGDQNKDAFAVDTNLIPQASLDEQTTELNALGLSVFNQDVFEEGVMNQVDLALEKEEHIRLHKILVKELNTINDDIKLAETDLARVESAVTRMEDIDFPNREAQRELESMRRQQSNKSKQLKTLSVRRGNVLKKIKEFEIGVSQKGSETSQNTTFDQAFQAGSKSKKETSKEKMMRMGEMTPFGTIIKNKPSANAIHISEYERSLKGGLAPGVKAKKDFSKYLKKKSLQARMPVRNDEASSSSNQLQQSETPGSEMEREISHSKLGKRQNRKAREKNNDSQDADWSEEDEAHRWDDEDGEIHTDDEFVPSKDDMQEGSSDENYKDLSDYSEEEGIMGMSSKRKRGKKPSVKRRGPRPLPAYREEDVEEPVRTKVKRDLSIRKEKDDADFENYQDRLLQIQKQEAKRKKNNLKNDEEEDADSEAEFEGGLQVPQEFWKKLFRYQKTGVRWLWELHLQQAGGIIGDEMGLGKTIQTIAFLAALRTSKVRNVNFPYKGLGPSIIICPTTIMHQWVKEFHKWWPEFRVAVLHSSGTFNGSESELVRSIAKSHGVLVTSYNTLVIHQELILRFNWHYVILDEGHKIRNPDAKITLCCKQFRTPHRIILSGSPIQNNLKELWSLFDFVFPGKLGTLPDFMQHFSVPIVQGGYSNATQMQVETAYRCACVLRDTINPYLIRRMKADVKANINLPNKNEQVLFCRITNEQREVYEEYLSSRECSAILQGKFKVFAGLITLRKICNHPDLSTGGPQIFKGDSIGNEPDLAYGFWRRSGKMIVVEALLRLWKKQERRVLLFTQSKSMLTILERFVQEQGYTYLTMDGGTTIGSRQPLVAQYNSDPSIYLFLLTTRVGGLGVNLTGADCVIIFDPDWNPSTDMQARERAWRIGQTKQVTIYRLLTSGTIEEKIYHRQIFKQFLTNRILKDPKQRRLFQSQQLYDLFTLGSKDNKEGTETSALFAGTGCDVRVPSKRKALNRFDEIKRRKEEEEEEKRRREEEKEVEDEIEEEDRRVRTRSRHEEEEEEMDCDLDIDEVNQMKELARKLSKKMEQDKQKKTEGDVKESGDDGAGKYGADDEGDSELQARVKQEPDDGSYDVGSNADTNTSTRRVHFLEDLQCEKENASNVLQRNSGVAKDGKSSSSSSSDTRKKWKIPHVKKEQGDLDVEERDSSSRSRDKDPKRNQREGERSRKTVASDDRDEDGVPHTKKKKRRHKDARFEGEKIPHLVKLCSAKGGKEGETEAGEGGMSEHEKKKKKEESKQEDDYVLRELFKKTGIDGAMKHDKIVDFSRPDYAIVEAEAERVAKEAAVALKLSRRQCASALSGEPTWTGQNGGSTSKPRFGQKKNSLLLNKADKNAESVPSTSSPSVSSATSSSSSSSTSSSNNVTVSQKSTPTKAPSSEKETLFDGSTSGSSSLRSKDNSLTSNDLLSKIRSRKRIASKPIEEIGDGDDEFLRPDIQQTLDPKDEELLRDIRDYIAFMATTDGQASTQEIVLNFGKRLPKSDAPKFKAMLKQVCELSCGVWRLKPEFR